LGNRLEAGVYFIGNGCAEFPAIGEEVTNRVSKPFTLSAIVPPKHA
jgi:hypothetical protein